MILKLIKSSLVFTSPRNLLSGLLELFNVISQQFTADQKNPRLGFDFTLNYHSFCEHDQDSIRCKMTKLTKRTYTCSPGHAGKIGMGTNKIACPKSTHIRSHRKFEL